MFRVDETRCNGCGSCIEICPSGAIELHDGVANIDETRCSDCGACVTACPTAAIQPAQMQVVPLQPKGTGVPTPVGTETQRALVQGVVKAVPVALGLLAELGRRWLDGRASRGRCPRGMPGQGGSRRRRGRW